MEYARSLFQPAWTWALALFCLLVTSVAGHAGITCRGSEARVISAPEHKPVPVPDSLSPRTLQVLRSRDEEASYRKNPEDTFARLQAGVLADAQPDLLFALAEIAYSLGRRAEKARGGSSASFYYLCSGYAYHFLFEPGAVSEGDVKGPVHVLYNAGLAGYLRATWSRPRDGNDPSRSHGQLLPLTANPPLYRGFASPPVPLLACPEREGSSLPRRHGT